MKRDSSKFIETVNENGGTVLGEYRSNRHPVLVSCSVNHVWSPLPSNIIKGSWCPACSLRPEITIEDCKQLASERGGECLSAEYKNSQIRMLWRCREGHEWLAPLKHIRNSESWCRMCSQKEKEANFIEKYGSNNPLNNLHIKKKALATILKKYGVTHPLKNKDVQDKVSKSSTKRITRYHWETGCELTCIASYEVGVVDHLNSNKIKYLWQPKVFEMPNGWTYRPDLYLIEDDKWVEIKGYFRNRSKEKWDWFHSTYTNSELWNETVLLEKGII